MLISFLAVLLVQQAPAGLTLADALARARAERGVPRAAAAGVLEARGERRFAGQVPNPTASYEHTQDTPREHLLFEQSLAWLFTRGPDRAATAAAIRRAQADSTLAMAGLAGEVRMAFYGALGAAESLRLVEEQTGLADSLERIAGARLRAGDISRFEYDQTAQETRRARQLLSVAREEANAARAELARAIGWRDATLPAPLGTLDADLDATHADSVTAEELPQVRIAVEDSARASLEGQSARRARLPLPSIMGGAEWNDPADPGRTLSVLGLSLPLPLWHSNGAEAAIAGARAERAAADAREVRLEAVRALAEARIRLGESALRARFARDSVLPAARELRRRAVTAYAAGETGVLPVLDALRGERETSLEGLRDLVAFQAALARFRTILGRVE